MMRKISLTTSGASPRLGSSSISRRGAPMSARPIASIWRSPPDSVPAACALALVQAREQRGRSSSSRAACCGLRRAALAVAAQQQVVGHRHRGEQGARLRHQRDAALHALLQRQALHRLTVERHLAARGQHAHQGVQQRALAGAVGADHGDHAAGLRPRCSMPDSTSARP